MIRSTLGARYYEIQNCVPHFAVVSSLCLETPQHKCRKSEEVPWKGGEALFAIAICGDLTIASPSTSLLRWRLEHNRRYWIGKSGGEVWVLARKVANKDSELHIQNNRFPKALWDHLRQFEILRERQLAA